METLVYIPTWLRLVVLFVGMYLVYKLWSAAVRARQELQATSWILKERRRAGIPDSDKRPFKIAKADVEEKQRVTSKSRDSDLRLRQPRVTFTPTAHKTRELSENHIVPPQEPLRRSKSITHRGNPLKKQQSNDDVLILNDENLTMVDENDSSTQKYLSGEKNPTLTSTGKQKRMASMYSLSELSNDLDTESKILKPRTVKKAKTHSGSPKFGSKRHEIRKNNDFKPLAHLPGELALGDIMMDEVSSNKNLAPEISTRSRKRILSDMVSKSDLAEESSKAKKGRSGEVTPPTVAEESENLVMKDQSQGPISPDKSLSSSSEEDIYMVTDEGVKKKLVKIVPTTLELDEPEDQPTIEKRWVTRQEFRSLAKNKMLLNTDQTWGNGSATSSETIDSSASANHSSSRTPLKQRASLEFEQGSIWNLQGKPSSRLVSPGSAVSNKMRSASRPRNSLGRLRLSFQQETPPTSNSRSYRLSLLGDDRYLDGKDSPTKTDVADKDLVASGERNSSKLAEKDSDISNPIVSPSPNEILQNPTVNDSSISTSDADVALQKKPNPPLFSNLQSTNQESLFKAGEIEPAKSDAVPTFNFGETKAGVNLPKNISGKPLKGENFKMGSDSLASPFSFSTGSSFASGSSGLYKQTPFSLATPTTSKQDSKALTIGSSTTIFGSQSFQPTQPLGNIFNTNTNSQVTSAGAPKPVLALSSGNESVNSSTPISSGIKSNLKTSNLFASPSFKTTAPSSNIFSSSSASFAFGESNSAQISEAVKNDAASAFKAPQASPASIFKPGGLGKTFGSTENSGFVSAQSEKSQSGAEKSLPSFSNSKQDSKGPEMTFNFQGTNLFSKNGGNTQNSQNESISSSSSPKPIGSTFPSNQSSQSDGAAAQQNSDTGSRSGEGSQNASNKESSLSLALSFNKTAAVTFSPIHDSAVVSSDSVFDSTSNSQSGSPKATIDSNLPRRQYAGQRANRSLLGNNRALGRAMSEAGKQALSARPAESSRDSSESQNEKLNADNPTGSAFSFKAPEPNSGHSLGTTPKTFTFAPFSSPGSAVLNNSNKDDKKNDSFNFNSSSESAVSKTSEATPSSFSFGIPKAPTTNSTASSFRFGVSEGPSSSSSTAPSLSFGNSKVHSTTELTTPSISFGDSKVASTATSTAPSFSFGALKATSITNSPASAFSFGAAKEPLSTSSFNFGASNTPLITSSPFGQPSPTQSPFGISPQSSTANNALSPFNFSVETSSEGTPFGSKSGLDVNPSIFGQGSTKSNSTTGTNSNLSNNTLSTKPESTGASIPSFVFSAPTPENK